MASTPRYSEPPDGWLECARGLGPVWDVTAAMWKARDGGGVKVYAMSSKLLIAKKDGYFLRQSEELDRARIVKHVREQRKNVRGCGISQFNLSMRDQMDSTKMAASTSAAATSARPSPMDEAQFADFYFRARDDVKKFFEDNPQRKNLLILVNCTHGKNRSGSAVVWLRLVARAAEDPARRVQGRGDLRALLRELEEEHRRGGMLTGGGVTDPDFLISLHHRASLHPKMEDIRVPQPCWAAARRTAACDAGFTHTSSAPLVPVPATVMDYEVYKDSPLRRAGSHGGHMSLCSTGALTAVDKNVTRLAGCGHNFNGPMPRESQREDFEDLDRCRRLFVTLKAEGDRGKLIHTNGLWFVVLRGNPSRAYAVRGPLGCFSPLIVLDCEFVLRAGGNGKTVCVVFDVLMNNDAEPEPDPGFLQKPFSERLKLRDRWIEWYEGAVRSVLADEEPCLTEAERARRTCPFFFTFEVFAKPFSKLEDLRRLLDEGSGVPTDGFVFYDETHTLGSGDERSILKWKEPKDQTVDLWLSRDKGLLMGDGKPVSANIIGDAPAPGFVYELRVTNVQNRGGGVNRERLVSGEVSFDVEVVRRRRDKTEMFRANQAETIAATVRAVRFPVDIARVVEKLQGAGNKKQRMR